MASYEELLSQIKSLEIQAEDARKQEIAGAIGEIRAIMAKFGITVDDLGGKGKAKRGSVAAKYRDPVSGKTWTGRGRRPAWAVELEQQGKSLEDFRA
ncbi:MAG: H-NS histone family protein [Betaproteobacteria bacterium]|nr:H-NS histone family protein [Betaproteobacteria bacterium]